MRMLQGDGPGRERQAEPSAAAAPAREQLVKPSPFAVIDRNHIATRHERRLRRRRRDIVDGIGACSQPERQRHRQSVCSRPAQPQQFERRRVPVRVRCSDRIEDRRDVREPDDMAPSGVRGRIAQFVEDFLDEEQVVFRERDGTADVDDVDFGRAAGQLAIRAGHPAVDDQSVVGAAKARRLDGLEDLGAGGAGGVDLCRVLASRRDALGPGHESRSCAERSDQRRRAGSGRAHGHVDKVPRVVAVSHPIVDQARVPLGRDSPACGVEIGFGGDRVLGVGNPVGGGGQQLDQGHFRRCGPWIAPPWNELREAVQHQPPEALIVSGEIIDRRQVGCQIIGGGVGAAVESLLAGEPEADGNCRQYRIEVR